MTSPTSPPPVDPARQQTIGLMLLALLWLGYCTYMATQMEQPEQEEDDTQELVDEDEKPAPDRPEIPEELPFDTEEEETDPPETQRDPEVEEDPGPQTQTQPEEEEAPREEVEGAFLPRRSLEDVRAGEVEAPATHLMRPVFSEYGGGLSDLFILNYQGFTGRDHRKREHIGEEAHILRPFRPWQLHFTADLRLRVDDEILDLGEGYLERARWEYVGHQERELTEAEAEPVRFVVGGEKERPEKRYEATFRYPPTQEEEVAPWWPEGFVIYRTFAYTDATYVIDVNYRFENHGPHSVEVRGTSRLNGPIGMNTSFFKPDETDALFMHGGHAESRLSIQRTGREEPRPESLGRQYREIALPTIFPRGFEITDEPRFRYLRATLPGTERDAVDWLGHTVRFMATATFAPRGLALDDAEETEAGTSANGDGEEAEFPDEEPVLWAPRVNEATVLPFRNPTPEVMPEVADEEADTWARWMLATSMRVDSFEIPPGETLAFQVRAYTGPTEPAHMEAAGLGDAVHYSYSWVEWLAVPLIAILEFFHGIFGNWGIAIILLTLLVRFLLFPVSWKSQYKMQEGAALMQLVQPDLEKLRKKHANNKQKMQQEQMKLFREKGIPMTGMLQGCLLMLLQMPIWIALFGAFRYYIGFYGADFLWINDLTSPDALITIGEFRLPYLPLLETFGLLGGQMTPSGVFHINILPVAVMFTMWFQMRFAQKQQSMAMDPDQQRTQKMMMGCMFIFFFFLFYTMPAGFNLYFLATTGYGLVETRILKPRIKEQIDKAHPGIYEKIEANQEKARQEKEREAKRMQAKAAKA